MRVGAARGLARRLAVLERALVVALVPVGKGELARELAVALLLVVLEIALVDPPVGERRPALALGSGFK